MEWGPYRGTLGECPFCRGVGFIGENDGRFLQVDGALWTAVCDAVRMKFRDERLRFPGLKCMPWNGGTKTSNQHMRDEKRLERDTRTPQLGSG